MNTSFLPRLCALAALALCSGIATMPMQAMAEDIDLFVGSSGGSADNANVLIVLDNTSNWSAANQKWPGGIKQGQAELNALKTVVGTLDSTINVGLMMFTDSGSGNEGGYIRSAVKQMTAANKTSLQNLLQTIYDNFQTPSEKVSSSATYGNPLFDVFKYFGGYTNPTHANDGVAGAPTDKTHYGPTVFNDLTPASKVDPAGYTSGAYTTFSSPISTTNSCAKNYIIFIGNGFPNADNATLLSNVGGDTTSIAVPTTTTTSTNTVTNLGLTASCYSNLASCSTSDFAACSDGTYNSCACSSSSTSAVGCTGSKLKYMVQGTTTTITVTPTGGYSQPGMPRTADEWTRFMYQTDVNAASGQQNVATYAIDVFNAQQSADQTALLMSMARVGGGKYFSATNQDKIVSALKEIFAEIQSVNSTFASASLPVNATNRAQNENQVFIGMFRPDPDAKPRWFGNLKRYQLISSGGNIELGDVNGNVAINSLTGFLTNCAASYWTSDSGTFWQNVTVNPSPASGCTTTANNKFSDAPDGPQVEKGAVAEVIRKGNNPPTTDTTPTWAVNRTVYTASGGALTAFTAASTGLSSTLVDFMLGKDVNDENANTNTTETRASIHGDVIHSRPLPVNYGGSTGVTAYYGSNDGTLRAIDAATGRERWAFIAPEFFSRLTRLKDNSPLVNYPNLPAGITPTPTAKDYFFDGSIGIYQNLDNSKVWIFPSMRRGGRMIYAFNVTDPASPTLKWSVGCPNLTNDTGCTSGMSGIGQTWSAPSVAFIKGYSTTTPVIVIGGGYDTCEDANSSSPSCGSPKGNAIYVLNADTGALITSFATTRSVVADISFVDIDNDGNADYVYAADTGGNIYRIDLINNPSSKTALASTAWTIHRVAYTNGSGRKFLFGPAVLPNATSAKAYVAIGSGDREHPLQTQYPYTDVTNRFYVYMDDLTSTAATAANSLDALEDYTSNTTCNTAKVLPSSTLKGWFMNLNSGAGEQTVTSALIAAGMVTFSTNRPIAAAAGQCSTTLGEARGYFVNLFNAAGAIGVTGSCGGTRSATFTGGGLPPSPVLASSVTVGGRAVSVVIGAIQKGSTGASSSIGAQEVTPPITSKRKRTYSYVKGDN